MRFYKYLRSNKMPPGPNIRLNYRQLAAVLAIALWSYSSANAATCPELLTNAFVAGPLSTQQLNSPALVAARARLTSLIKNAKEKQHNLIQEGKLSELRRLAEEITTETGKYWKLLGVSFHQEPNKFDNTIQLIIEPGETTPLNRFVKALGVGSRTRIIFYPYFLLQASGAEAAYIDNSNSVVLSLDSAVEFDSRNHQFRHELRHAHFDTALLSGRLSDYHGQIFAESGGQLRPTPDFPYPTNVSYEELFTFSEDALRGLNLLSNNERWNHLVGEAFVKEDSQHINKTFSQLVSTIMTGKLVTAGLAALSETPINTIAENSQLSVQKSSDRKVAEKFKLIKVITVVGSERIMTEIFAPIGLPEEGAEQYFRAVMERKHKLAKAHNLVFEFAAVKIQELLKELPKPVSMSDWQKRLIAMKAIFGLRVESLLRIQNIEDVRTLYENRVTQLRRL